MTDSASMFPVDGYEFAHNTSLLVADTVIEHKGRAYTLVLPLDARGGSVKVVDARTGVPRWLSVDDAQASYFTERLAKHLSKDGTLPQDFGLLARKLISDGCMARSLSVDASPDANEDRVLPLANAIREGLCFLHTLNVFNALDATVGVLAEALNSEAGGTMRKLCLRDGSVHANHLASLAVATRAPHCFLTNLALENMSLDDECARTLSEAFCGGRLRFLDLGANCIGVAGARALAGMLKGSCALEELRVCYNEFGADGISEFSKAFACDECTLRAFSCVGNYIGDAGARHIANALRIRSRSIRTLNLGFNFIGEEGASALAEALKAGGVRELGLSENYVKSTGAVSIADALSDPACALQSLNLFSNGIRSTGIASLALAMQSDSCSLRTLNVSDNLFGRRGSAALRLAISSATCSLVELRAIRKPMKDVFLDESIALAVSSGACCLRRLAVRSSVHIAEALGSERCTLEEVDISASMWDCYEQTIQFAKVFEETLREKRCVTLKRIGFLNRSFDSLKEPTESLCARNRRLRMMGLLHAATMLMVHRLRACKAMYHPKRLKREGFFTL